MTVEYNNLSNSHVRWPFAYFFLYSTTHNGKCNFKIQSFVSMLYIIDRNKCKFQSQMFCYAKTRQAMYVKRNIEARSRKHCFKGETVLF